MKRTFVAAAAALFATSISAAPAWIHNNSIVTGFRLLDNQMIIYYKGGAGPCGGNGEFPFVVSASSVSQQTFNAIQSAVMFAYASGKQISVYGDTCETITQVRIHESTTNFGNR